MTIEELIAQLVLQLPNVAVAIWSLYWSFGRLERMIEVHSNLIDRLLSLLTSEGAAHVLRGNTPVRDSAAIPPTDT